MLSNDRNGCSFVKKYGHWTADKWSHVMFSDEATFCQFGSVTRYVRRPAGHRYDHRYTIATMKHAPQVMVWGCFSAAGRGSLYFVEQNKKVNGAEYINILSTKLKMAMQLNGCRVFQQDSAPAHTCRAVKNWLTTNGVQVLEWPGNSPDLNPIENLWSIMKRHVRLYHPRNMQELLYYIKRVWCQEISKELCQKLVRSMPNRLKTVKNSKGYATRY